MNFYFMHKINKIGFISCISSIKIDSLLDEVSLKMFFQMDIFILSANSFIFWLFNRKDARILKKCSGLKM